MLFSSLVFLYVFLPFVLVCYYATKSPTARNYILLFFSLVFYSWGEPRLIFSLVCIAFVNFVLALWIHKYKGKTLAKFGLSLAILLDIGSLVYFKYAMFFLTNLSLLFGVSLATQSIVLPIGISFYTFQILTYVVDAYRGEATVQRNFAKFLLYVSMFPQLIAGPIVRYVDIQNQIDERKITSSTFASGIIRFLIGLTKKVLIANRAGAVVALMLDGSDLQRTTLVVWYGVIMYTIQIYFDFSGYSDMAIGLGRMFGFEFLENFNYPYQSRSVTEFWRRWHMSLSSFFKDYVYIPLGGNRKHQIRNIFIVWLLTGLWHGASWNFIFWGLYYFVALMVEKKLLSRVLPHLPRVVCHLYTMFAVVVGWEIFYFTNTKQLLKSLWVMFVKTTAPEDLFALQSIRDHIFFIIISCLCATEIPIKTCRSIGNIFAQKSCLIIFRHMAVVLFVILSLFVCTAQLVGQTYNPFLYFRF